jgi:protein gp37
MADKSSIEWTEATLNAWTGCRKCSAGCAHCYIEHQPPFRIPGRRFVRGETLFVDGGGEVVPGQESPVVYHLERIERMVRRKKPTVYFVNSLSDVFLEDVPDEVIALLFAGMALAPQHTFQVLTKRPERMCELLTSDDWPMMVAEQVWAQEAATVRKHGDSTWHRTRLARYNDRLELPHVWLGVTVENRAQVKRADLLRATPAAVRFLSCEPLLGPLLATDEREVEFCEVDGRTYPVAQVRGTVDRTWWEPRQAWPDGKLAADVPELDLSGISWVIAGGESGPGARPCREEWLRDLRDACLAAGTVCSRCEGRAGPVPPGSQFGATESMDPAKSELLWCPECGSTGRVNRPLFFLKQLGGHPDKRGHAAAVLDRRLWHEMPPLRAPEPAQSALL